MTPVHRRLPAALEAKVRVEYLSDTLVGVDVVIREDLEAFFAGELTTCPTCGGRASEICSHCMGQGQVRGADFPSRIEAAVVKIKTDELPIEAAWVEAYWIAMRRELGIELSPETEEEP